MIRGWGPWLECWGNDTVGGGDAGAFGGIFVRRERGEIMCGRQERRTEVRHGCRERGIGDRGGWVVTAMSGGRLEGCCVEVGM